MNTSFSSLDHDVNCPLFTSCTNKTRHAVHCYLKNRPIHPINIHTARVHTRGNGDIVPRALTSILDDRVFCFHALAQRISHNIARVRKAWIDKHCFYTKHRALFGRILRYSRELKLGGGGLNGTLYLLSRHTSKILSNVAMYLSGVPRNFVRGWGGVNKFSWGQRERGSGGGSPLVRCSGGSCNLVQEISFHIVKFP